MQDTEVFYVAESAGVGEVHAGASAEHRLIED